MQQYSALMLFKEDSTMCINVDKFRRQFEWKKLDKGNIAFSYLDLGSSKENLNAHTLE